MKKDSVTREIEKTGEAGGPSFRPDIKTQKPSEREGDEKLKGKTQRLTPAGANAMEKDRRTVGPDLENYGAVKKPKTQK